VRYLPANFTLARLKLFSKKKSKLAVVPDIIVQKERTLMEYTITLTEEELGLVLLALVPNRELQQKIKDQSWKQNKISA
jgi:hypothetical protein